jgi:hypothetical protein
MFIVLVVILVIMVGFATIPGDTRVRNIAIAVLAVLAVLTLLDMFGLFPRWMTL